MLDIGFIRENRRLIEENNKKRGVVVDIDHLLEIDDERRSLIQKVEALNRDRKETAEKRDVEKGKKIKIELAKKEAALTAVEQEFKAKLYEIPNLVLDSVPEGDESANKVLRKTGEPEKFDFPPKDHLQIGEGLGIVDMARAVKVSGSRFGFLKNDGALLEIALVQYAMRVLYQEGFSPVIPPALIKKEITDGLGYWQAKGNENFYLVSDLDLEGPEKGKQLDLYLIGTGEHAIVPMHLDETLAGLPRRYAAFSPCFRREAGSYGKDTKGIFRVHQFDKVEMISFVRPVDDQKERNKMLELAEKFVQDLELPYRVVQLAAGDLSFPSAETIDIETWVPSQKKYRETHSISTTTDFQARRLNIKYKNGNKFAFAHILNGTAIAIGRTIAAILENHQQKDGSVRLPKALHEYMGKSSLHRP